MRSRSWRRSSRRPRMPGSSPRRSLTSPASWRREASIEEGFWGRAAAAREPGDRPLVVVLDDAHWAEATLLALIENIARHAESVPILLVCVSRPDLLERRADWGASAERSTIVKLEPLDEAACDRLIGELLGEPGADSRGAGITWRPGRGQSAVRRADDFDAHRRRKARAGGRTPGGRGRLPDHGRAARYMLLWPRVSSASAPTSARCWAVPR